MPPRERHQLTSLEIDVIGSWIEEGASFEQTVRALKHPALALEFLETRSSASGSLLPVEEVAAPDEEAVKMLRDSGVVVLPVSGESHYLVVSFSTRHKATPRDAGLIKSIAANIIELDLSGCQVSPEMMEAVGGLTALRKLSLRKSTCSDADLQKLTTLTNLTVLNISSTGITDAGVRFLQGSSLREVFLYQTKVTTAGVLSLKSLVPNLRIDTGNYRLPFLASDTVHYKR